MNNNKYLSVVVPAHNAALYIERCLSAIRTSDFTDYELIVVDDGSTDKTAEIARKYADKVISLQKCSSRLAVRLAGFESSNSSIIVNIDSDVEIKSDSLRIIYQHFRDNPAIGALTGMLAIESPLPDFFSAYKNLYMNFIFSKLPDRVTFLYGSVFAIRRDALTLALETLSDRSLCSSITDDSEFGQVLVTTGIKIGFARHLEVYHHKAYTFRRLLRNDFLIPRDFARLLLRFRRKPKLSFKMPVFLHTSLAQVIAICAAYLTLASLFFVPLLCLPALCIWFLSNLAFFSFLRRNRGLKFTAVSVLFTFLDQITMGLGIAAGFIGNFKYLKLIPLQAEVSRLKAVPEPGKTAILPES